MDGETQKGNEQMEKCKGNRTGGETQNETNGWGNTKRIEWVRKLIRIRMDGETKRIEWIRKH